METSTRRGSGMLIALVLLVVSLNLHSVSAFEVNASSYTVDSFHSGSAGSNGESSSYRFRFTSTYQQGSNSNVTSASYLANSGWFKLALTTHASGSATIHSVECSNDTVNYYNCSGMGYQANVTHIRVHCTADYGNVSGVRYTLHNLPDNVSYIDNVSYTYRSGDYYILNSSYLILDSGDWNLTITCTANDTARDYSFWSLGWGWLNITLVQPTVDTSVQIYRFFTFRSSVTCIDGECGNVSVTLDPIDGGNISLNSSDLNATTENTTLVYENATGGFETNHTVQNQTEGNTTVNDTFEVNVSFNETVGGNITVNDTFEVNVSFNETVGGNITVNGTVGVNVTVNGTAGWVNETGRNWTETLAGRTYDVGEVIGQDEMYLGRKTGDSPDYETYFQGINKTDTELVIVFLHEFNDTLPVWVEGNVSYNLSGCTAGYLENITLKVDLIDDIIPLFELYVGGRERFRFGKMIPEVNMEGGHYYLKNRGDGKLDVEVVKEGNMVVLWGVEDQRVINVKIGSTGDEEITTCVAVVENLSMEHATITLKKEGEVNRIFYCSRENFDLNSMTCVLWEATEIAFTDDGGSVTFTVEHFSAYAGGNYSANETGYLIVWDETDPGMPNASKNRDLGEQVLFFADYLVTLNGTKIVDGNCSINFNGGGYLDMGYNTTYGYYVCNRSFSTPEVYVFNVRCDHPVYSGLNATDTLAIPTGTKSGAVSTTPGAVPFYTSSSNPQMCSILRAGDNCLTTWLVNATGILNSIHTFFVIYNMTSNQAYVADNRSGMIQVTITANDTVNPVILGTTVDPRVIYIGQTVSLYSTAEDNVQLDLCWADITLPDSSVVRINDTCSSSQSYVTAQAGRHDVVFMVNDTSGNVGNASDYFIVQAPFNFTTVTRDSVGDLETELSIIYPGTGEVIHRNNTNGSYTVTLPVGIYHLLYKAYLDRLHVMLRDINITLDNNLVSGMDRLGTPVVGYLVTYGVSNNYTFTNATVIIYYDDLLVVNESYLGLYRCSNWNFTNQTCNGSWQDITGQATQDTDDDRFQVDVTGFSGFSIKQEPIPTTTTTIATTTTVYQGNGGNGGGGGGGGGGGFSSVATTKATCFDGLINCHDDSCEEGVDCGGPCEPCPSCEDGIQNQGELGIDCGGPCTPCVTTSVTTTFITTSTSTAATTSVSWTTSTTVELLTSTSTLPHEEDTNGFFFVMLVFVVVILLLLLLALYKRRHRKRKHEAKVVSELKDRVEGNGGQSYFKITEEGEGGKAKPKEVMKRAALKRKPKGVKRRAASKSKPKRVKRRAASKSNSKRVRRRAASNNKRSNAGEAKPED